MKLVTEAISRNMHCQKTVINMNRCLSITTNKLIYNTLQKNYMDFAPYAEKQHFFTQIHL